MGLKGLRLAFKPPSPFCWFYALKKRYNNLSGYVQNFIICIMVWSFYIWHGGLQLVGMLDLVPIGSRNSRFFFKMWRKETTNKTIIFYSQQNLFSIQPRDHFSIQSHSAWRRYGTHFKVNTNHTLHISGGPMITTYDCANSLWFPGEWKKDAHFVHNNLLLSHFFSCRLAWWFWTIAFLLTFYLLLLTGH